MGSMRASACLLALSLAAGPRAAGPAPAPGGSLPQAGPAGPDRYTGLGYADKRAHPADYRDRARLAALAEIARAISVSIRASAQASRSEGADGYHETWSETAEAVARAELSGYRLEGSRETEDGYWALYALDREDYERAQARSAASFSAWLEARAGDVEAGLAARRIQSARDAERAAADSVSRRGGLPPGAEPAWERFRRASLRLSDALRGSRWAPSAPWLFAPPPVEEGRPAPPRLRLLDAAGAEWPGPYRVVIRPVGGGAPACEAWIDAEGRPDLPGAFLGCGLPEGTWRVEWAGPDPDPAPLEVRAAWIPLRVRVEAEAAPRSGWAADAAIAERLRSGLAARCGPRYRAIPADAKAPVLSLRVIGASLDSLEGIRFASLRGELSWPGAREPVRVAGEGGDPDPDRARSRALEDFLEAASRALRSGG